MKMKKKHILPILFVSAGLLFNACQESDTLSGGNEQGSVPLSISGVSITGSSVSTRAELASVSDIGVFRLVANGYTAQSNIEYKNTSGTWAAADNSNRILLGSPDATLYTYAPYSSAVTDFTSVPMTSGIYSASTDLCYGNKLGVNSNNIGSGVPLSMKHAYAELTLNLTRDLTLTGTGNVNSITISGAASSGTLNISSGTMTSATSGNVVLSGAPLCTISLPSATQSVEVLMVPTSVSSSGLTFSLNVDGTTRTCTVPSSQISKLEGGNNYSVNINLAVPQPESNCYIIPPNGTLCIPVSRATTGNAANFPDGASFTCGLLWSDVSATHVSATVYDRYIKVIAGSSEGNSVVYAKNANGDIVWSWHIWVTGYNPDTKTNGTTYTSSNGLTWMDRNLGATAIANGINTFATCGGLMYQWGRKDPFPGSDGSTTSNATTKTIYGYIPVTAIDGVSTIAVNNDSYVRWFNAAVSPVSYTNQAKYSIQYPLVFFIKWAGSTATTIASDIATGGIYSWNSSSNTKTIYDPCPAGWRVPNYINVNTSPWDALSFASNMNNLGTVIAYENFQSYSFGNYPTSGYRYNGFGSIVEVGFKGAYWSASVNGSYSCHLFFNSPYVYPQSSTYYRAGGFNIRCVKGS
jgi:uncharacterized protein (TIGR02145 family)